MRKLKLQTHISIDGYICGPNDEMDWITWDMDAKLGAYVTELIDTSDTIFLGRKMTGGFMDYWSKALDDASSPMHEFAKKMIDTPKVVFTKTLNECNWVNTTLAKDDLTEEVNKLKNQAGKDIILYGGASLDASMISAGLIDEYHLFVNPAAIGKGKPIFIQRTDLELVKVLPFECGIVVLVYQPRTDKSK